jgi:hypothetical protein
MSEKLEELQALLDQDESNLTDYGKERIKSLQKELHAEEEN